MRVRIPPRAYPATERAGNVPRGLIDHVNNLKLQYLVELSKLGDTCAGLERDVAEWLHEHDVRPATVRVDVVAVRTARRGAATVEHLRGVL